MYYDYSVNLDNYPCLLHCLKIEDEIGENLGSNWNLSLIAKG